jgi:two-component system chemotaxis sensor kinase CheA
MWSSLGKYKAIVVSIALFLILDASVLTLNFYISYKIADDAVDVNLSGRQRMLSQRMVKSLYAMETNIDNESAFLEHEQELALSYNLFNQTLLAFDQGGATLDANGVELVLESVSDAAGRVAIIDANEIWSGYGASVLAILNAQTLEEKRALLPNVIDLAGATNVTLLGLMNDLTVSLEKSARDQATMLRYIQTGGICLAILNFFLILFHFLGELKTNDRKLEAARQETTQILDTVNEGLFLLDKDLKLGSQHSAQLPALFGGKNVEDVQFSDLVRDLVKPKDLETAERFISLLFKKNIKANLIRDLNPLNEVEINIPDNKGGYQTRYLSFEFSRVGSGDNLGSILVTVNDITRSIVLEKELAVAKEKSEQQMEILTSILHADPKSLGYFVKDSFDAFSRINHLLKDQGKNDSAYRRKLNDIFVEVHNFKGDASALELDHFAEMAHAFEDDIERIQNLKKISGNDFLKLAVHLENLMKYTESVNDIAAKLSEFAKVPDRKSIDENARPVTRNVTQQLYNLCTKVANEEGKQCYLAISGFEELSVPDETLGFLKDMSVQLIRNAIVHSVELPSSRRIAGKPEIARIDLHLTALPDQNVELSVKDDGTGIDYEKIRSKAEATGRWADKHIESWNNKQLLTLIFEPGFSTAESVSANAGRGVGMDVIRKKINEHSGKLKISSRKGVDCQFTITVPLNKNKTMAA